jgi:hypothetical protein
LSSRGDDERAKAELERDWAAWEAGQAAMHDENEKFSLLAAVIHTKASRRGRGRRPLLSGGTRGPAVPTAAGVGRGLPPSVPWWHVAPLRALARSGNNTVLTLLTAAAGAALVFAP